MTDVKHIMWPVSQTAGLHIKLKYNNHKTVPTTDYLFLASYDLCKLSAVVAPISATR